MGTEAVDKKSLLIAFILSLTVTLGMYIISLIDTRTKIVFCDVGQGDATYIRINNSFDMLIDAGPDQSILRCLGKHMPFYDHTIELALLSHPQKDHYYGFIPVLEHYKVQAMILNQGQTSSSLYTNLLENLTQKHISLIYPYNGKQFYIDGDILTIFWPTVHFSRENDISKRDANDFSIIVKLSEGMFSVLFTGDASPFVLKNLLEQANIKSSVLKIPHHGSKNGLTPDFLRLADPSLSVISVGAHNSYNHPSPEVLDMLKAFHKQYLRTDQMGDIILRVDENTFSIQ